MFEFTGPVKRLLYEVLLKRAAELSLWTLPDEDILDVWPDDKNSG